MSSLASRVSLRPLAIILVLASSTAAALVGCGGTAEDDPPAAGNGSGATGGSGGSGGGSGSGSGGSAAGAAPMAGAAGAAAGNTGAPLPDVGCDYTMAIGRSCAIAGCHTAKDAYGGLNLTVDMGLRSRLVDVPAKHADIICDITKPDEFCRPAACPSNAKLLDSANPDASWVFAKLGMTPTGCGDQMPLPPGNAADRWTAERQECLQKFFRALALGGPAPGTGGTGSGGSGGASSGGSAGSATGGNAGTTTGGSAGSATGGNAGSATGGNAGSATGGNAGTSGGGGNGGGAAGGGNAGQGGANGGVAGSL
jgi:hypothetical protein